MGGIYLHGLRYRRVIDTGSDSVVAGDEVEKDFGLRIPASRPVIGALKFAWRINLKRSNAQ